MANPNTPEQTSATPEESAEDAPVQRNRKLPLLLLAGIGLAVGAGTGALLIGPMVAKKLAKTPVAIADSTEAASEEKGGSSLGNTAPPVLLLDNLVLNPAGSGGSRFLLASIAIECADAKTLASLQARDPELRDALLTALGAKTIDELTDVGSREQLKTEIQNTLGDRFGKKSIKRVYFPQFVVQ